MLCGAGLCLKRFARAPRWRAGAGTLLLGLLFFFGAGEEISWGQRLFDLESPDFFQEHNVKGETNLHNLVIGGVKINKVLFSFVLGICIVAYFFVLPVLYRRVRRIRDWADRWALPVPRWIHVASFALVVVLVAAMPSPRALGGARVRGLRGVHAAGVASLECDATSMNARTLGRDRTNDAHA